jgi:hypothetical protein
MAKEFRFLHDIDIKKNAPVYSHILNSPLMSIPLMSVGLQLVTLYQSTVGVKSGRLRASARAGVRGSGGKKRDRMIGVVTIADASVVAPEPYKGRPFYYGVFHEEGNKKKGRAKKRKYGTDGAHELRQAAIQMRGGG